ncbi:hypothetical protein [Agilicoccus flavus]|uniref:hypothetical protein n=1 Tax=Agilicoccus flavus TaxID=2775968 RepID=UPI001CF6208A|nr:hypothetical protein [Agilicoccus flavus]
MTSGAPTTVAAAILLAVAAAVVFAFAASEQHAVVQGTLDADDAHAAGGTRLLGPRRVGTLLTSRAWLSGIGLGGVGSALHVVALALAPVMIVQPVGVLAVPFGVLVQARRSGRRAAGRVLAAAALTVTGVAVFVVVAAFGAHSTNEVHTQDVGLTTLGLMGGAVALALVAGRGPDWLVCVAYAAAGAVLYGLASALVRTITLLVAAARGFEGPLWSLLAGGVACIAVGGWMIQQAFAHGPPEVILGALTVIDPIVAVLFGLTFLGEGDRNGSVAVTVMAAAGAVAALGVVLLARHHPDARALPLVPEGPPS